MARVAKPWGRVVGVMAVSCSPGLAACLTGARRFFSPNHVRFRQFWGKLFERSPDQRAIHAQVRSHRRPPARGAAGRCPPDGGRAGGAGRALAIAVLAPDQTDGGGRGDPRLSRRARRRGARPRRHRLRRPHAGEPPDEARPRVRGGGGRNPGDSGLPQRLGALRLPAGRRGARPHRVRRVRARRHPAAAGGEGDALELLAQGGQGAAAAAGGDAAAAGRLSPGMTEDVARHYAGERDLVARARALLREAGKNLDRLTVDDLAGLDEFHIRGRDATHSLAARLALAGNEHVLDVGSGIGGPARRLATLHPGLDVTGIDLTPEFCRVANELSRLVGLAARVRFEPADATRLPFADAAFDVAWTQHVQMNIADKRAFYGEIARVLRPGGKFAFYDILQGPGGPVVYPAPWASDP